MRHFIQQLRFWSLYVPTIAVSSLFLAVIPAEIQSRDQLLAMMAGIISYIFIFSLISRTTIYRKKFLPSLWGKAFRTGLNIRLAVSIVSVPGIFLLSEEKLLFILPDCWCGVGAGLLLLGLQIEVHYPDLETAVLPIYFMTMLTGFMILLSTIMLSFFALIFLNSNELKKFYNPKTTNANPVEY